MEHLIPSIIRRTKSLFSFFFVGIILFFVAACSDRKNLNERTAISEIAYHLESNPVFETAILQYGEVKFTTPKDEEKLANYASLEQYGYVQMELQKEKKKFLSRDSILTYNIHLQDKTIPFVIKKTDNSFEVRTFYYELDESQGVLIEQTGKNRAKVTVTLLRKDTDFAMFDDKSKASNSSFIKKSYNFRFDEQNGWQVSR